MGWAIRQHLFHNTGGEYMSPLIEASEGDKSSGRLKDEGSRVFMASLRIRPRNIHGSRVFMAAGSASFGPVLGIHRRPILPGLRVHEAVLLLATAY